MLKAEATALTRVGNSLFGFLSKLLVFCERKSDSFIVALFKEQREQVAPFTLKKKSNKAKSDRNDSLLGIKRGKAVKNI